MSEFPARELLARQGYPVADAHALPDSPATFTAGGHYGIELSSINNPSLLESMLNLAREHAITVDRIDECRGIGRLPDAEIRAMAQLCREHRIGLILSVGPRALY